MIERAIGVGPSKIDIAYECLGDPAHPPLVLIMGLGAQLITWPEGLLDELLARGLYLVRFDNRDAGESTHFQGVPDFPAAMRGDFYTVLYRLTDMAGDTLGLLDVLGIARAHFVGASMGGFIAQTIAIAEARQGGQRVRSLTSIMATTRAPGVGQLIPRSCRNCSRAASPTRARAIEQALHAAQLVGTHPVDVEAVTECAGRTTGRVRAPGHGGPRIRRSDARVARARCAGSRDPRQRGQDVRRQWWARDRRRDPGRGARGDRRHGTRSASQRMADDRVEDRRGRPAR